MPGAFCNVDRIAESVEGARTKRLVRPVPSASLSDCAEIDPNALIILAKLCSLGLSNLTGDVLWISRRVPLTGRRIVYFRNGLAQGWCRVYRFGCIERMLAFLSLSASAVAAAPLPVAAAPLVEVGATATSSS